MSEKHYFLNPGESRSKCLDVVFFDLANLPRDRRYLVGVELANPKLPHSLMARIKIPVRQIGKQLGIPYPEMSDILRRKFYPTKIVRIGDSAVELPKHTNELTPEEAREVEIHIHSFGIENGCSLTTWSGGGLSHG